MISTTAELQCSSKSVDLLKLSLIIGCLLLIPPVMALLRLSGISTLPFLLLIAIGSYLWLVLRRPLGSLGIALALMPVFPLAFLVARFFGPPQLASMEGVDRLIILLPLSILWWRNGIKFATPDWLLLGCILIPALRLFIDGSLVGFVTDFGFLIPYFAGRVVVLNEEQQQKWAQRSVWIVAILAVAGLMEVFVFGAGPRTVLYLSVAEKATFAGALDGSFRATGFTGLRESSTMFGPLQFAPLCMVALMIWWVYCRAPLLACMVAIGLVCSLSRSAWIGSALAIPLLALVMRQTKRLLMYVCLGLALLIACAPVLGINDFLFATKTGQDPSAQGHQASLLNGLQFLAQHPLGIGSANLGRQAEKSNAGAFSSFESTYLTFAAQYGILPALSFMGFLAAVLWRVHSQRTRLAYAALAIAVGFGAVMMVLPIHDVFPLACWVWFPVGLAIRSSQRARFGQPICRNEQIIVDTKT